jgi:hypothetical protein
MMANGLLDGQKAKENSCTLKVKSMMGNGAKIELTEKVDTLIKMVRLMKATGSMINSGALGMKFGQTNPDILGIT